MVLISKAPQNSASSPPAIDHLTMQENMRTNITLSA